MDIGIVSNFIDEYNGGIGVYTHQIVKNLNKMDTENNYHLIHYLKNNLDIYSQNNEIIIPKIRFVRGGEVICSGDTSHYLGSCKNMTWMLFMTLMSWGHLLSTSRLEK